MENTFTINIHNTNLHFQYWKSQIVKSAIVLVHGMGSHKLRFEDSVIKHLVKSGYAVVEFCKNIENAQLELFEEGYHELHHDLCREEFIQTVLKIG